MTQMTPARFAALLDAYGADPARWPEGERAAALAFLDADPAARQARADAARLDAVLDRAPVEPPSAALMDRVLAAAPPARPAPPQPRALGPGGRIVGWLGALVPGAGAWQPTAALAAALVLGLAVGYATAPFGTALPVDGQSLDAIALGTFAEPEGAGPEDAL